LNSLAQTLKSWPIGKSAEGTVSCSGFQTTEFPPTLSKTFFKVAFSVAVRAMCFEQVRCGIFIVVFWVRNEPIAGPKWISPPFSTHPPLYTTQRCCSAHTNGPKPRGLLGGKLWLGIVFPREDFTPSVGLKNCLQMEMKRVCKGK